MVINIDWGTGRLKRYNDGIERIIGYTFYEQDKMEFNIRKEEEKNLFKEIREKLNLKKNL